MGPGAAPRSACGACAGVTRWAATAWIPFRTRNFMERRVLIAVILSFLVLYGYQALFIPPPPAPASQAPAAQQPAAAPGAQPPAAAAPAAPGTTSPPAALTPAAPAPAATISETAERTIVVETATVE